MIWEKNWGGQIEMVNNPHVYRHWTLRTTPCHILHTGLIDTRCTDGKMLLSLKPTIWVSARHLKATHPEEISRVPQKHVFENLCLCHTKRRIGGPKEGLADRFVVCYLKRYPSCMSGSTSFISSCREVWELLEVLSNMWPNHLQRRGTPRVTCAHGGRGDDNNKDL